MRRSQKELHNSLQRSPGASLLRVEIIVTLEPLPARGRAGRGEEGWLRLMGVKEGQCQVFQVVNGSGGFHFVIQADECNIIG